MMYINSGCNGVCGNVLCSQHGCLKQMAGIGTEGNEHYTYVPPPRGCICPPGANKECENQYCPRNPVPPVSALMETKK